MSQSSAIEWTDATWNPTTGCDRVSPGCAHCYALTLAGRLKEMGQARYQRDGDPQTSGPGFGLTLHPDKLDEPLRWRKPRMVFVNSMSDLFHEEIPASFIRDVFETMARAPQHTFQVLTKRPERARQLFDRGDLRGRTGASVDWPLPNVWLGVSIENARYTWRADVLREIPAAVRFISAEPLLGPLVPSSFARGESKPYGWYFGRQESNGTSIRWTDDPGLDLTGIDWLIVGGESGSNFRPLNLDHARELRDACMARLSLREARATGHSTRPFFFFKQVGGRTPKAGGRLLDGREWNELPVREAVAA